MGAFQANKGSVYQRGPCRGSFGQGANMGSFSQGPSRGSFGQSTGRGGFGKQGNRESFGQRPARREGWVLWRLPTTIKSRTWTAATRSTRWVNNMENI